MRGLDLLGLSFIQSGVIATIFLLTAPNVWNRFGGSLFSLMRKNRNEKPLFSRREAPPDAIRRMGKKAMKIQITKENFTEYFFSPI